MIMLNFGDRIVNKDDSFTIVNIIVGNENQIIYQVIETNYQTLSYLKLIPQNLGEQQLQVLQLTINDSYNFPNICRVFQKFTFLDQTYLQTEYYDTTLDKLQLINVNLMCKHIVEAVSQLHYYNIRHGNIRPQNIAVTSHYGNQMYKLTDFGEIHSFRNQRDCINQSNSYRFNPPEKLKNLKSDIWQLGLLIFWVYSNRKFLFDGNQVQVQQSILNYMNNQQDIIHRINIENFSYRIKQLIIKMLYPKQSQRPDIKQVQRELQESLMPHNAAAN